MGVSGPSLLIESTDSTIIERERNTIIKLWCIMKVGCCWWGSVLPGRQMRCRGG